MPNWKGEEVEAAAPIAALLLVLLLVPKGNTVVLCCGGFWFAPKVNILLVVLFSFALVFPKVGLVILGVPNVEDCDPNGETLLSPNVAVPFGVPVAVIPNVGFDEIEVFCPENVLFDAEELKWLVPLFEAPNTGPAVFSPLNIEFLTPKFCESEFWTSEFPLFWFCDPKSEVTVFVAPKVGTDALLTEIFVEPKVETVELLETFAVANVDDVVGCEPNNAEPLLFPNTPGLFLKFPVEFVWPKILFVVGNIDAEVVEFTFENKLLPTLFVPPLVIPEVDKLVLEPNTGIEVVFVICIEDPLIFEKIGIEFVDANPVEVVETLEPKTDVIVLLGRVKIAVVVFELEGVPKTDWFEFVVVAPKIDCVDGELVNMEPVFETNWAVLQLVIEDVPKLEFELLFPIVNKVVFEFPVTVFAADDILLKENPGLLSFADEMVEDTKVEFVDDPKVGMLVFAFDWKPVLVVIFVIELVCVLLWLFEDVITVLVIIETCWDVVEHPNAPLFSDVFPTEPNTNPSDLDVITCLLALFPNVNSGVDVVTFDVDTIDVVIVDVVVDVLFELATFVILVNGVIFILVAIDVDSILCSLVFATVFEVIEFEWVDVKIMLLFPIDTFEFESIVVLWEIDFEIFWFASVFAFAIVVLKETGEDIGVVVIKFPKMLVVAEITERGLLFAETVSTALIGEVVTVDVTEADLSKLNVCTFELIGLDVFVFEITDWDIISDFVLVNVILGAALSILLAEVEMFSFLLLNIVAKWTFVFEELSLSDKLKVTCFGDFVLNSLVPGLGATADVEMGVVLTFVVVVEELSVTQVTGHATGLTIFTSSAWITTSGFIWLAAKNRKWIVSLKLKINIFID